MTDNVSGSRRWYDSTRVIVSLFAVVAVLVGLLYASATSSINRHTDQINAIERRNERIDEKLDAMKASIDRIEKKLDK